MPAAPAEEQSEVSLVAACYQLLRPGILAMVLVSMLAAAWIGEPMSWAAVAHAMIGTSAVIAGALAANQRIERRGDSRMQRTAMRPLPSRRFSARQVSLFAAVATTVGVVYLAVACRPLVVGLAVTSWLLYVAAYTPLKYRSVWQTPVGAAAGAMPVLIGAAAASQSINLGAWVLFGVLFLWQFPHAMAIAWLYREEFRAAGVKLAVVTDPTGRSTAAMALAGALCLLPLTLHPALAGWSPSYVGATSVAWVIQVIAAVRFAQSRDDIRARHLLRASMLYLPVVLAAAVFAS